VDDPAVLDLIRTVVSGMPPGTRLDDARTRVIAALDPGDVDTTEQVSEAFTQLAQAAPGATARAALARFRERDHEGAVGPGVHLLNAHRQGPAVPASWRRRHQRGWLDHRAARDRHYDPVDSTDV
jgi:DNA helicase-2/ATP-dependent DNA helicase PcrA